MNSKVYFIGAAKSDGAKTICDKISKIIETAGIGSCLLPGDLTAIKVHFGEKGNNGHLKPEWIRPVSKLIQKYGARPFITETCTLYKGERSDAVAHLILAHQHGFTLAATGAPVVIADGLLGADEVTVKIDAKHYREVPVAAAVVRSQSMVVMSHVTGHLKAGLGATIKNIGMGASSRKGKLSQHSSVKPSVIGKKCKACGQCVKWCPAGAVVLRDNVAFIDSGKCIGCGECLAVCRFNAVAYNWEVSSRDLQEKMAEHALGAVKDKMDKCLFLNFIIHVTKDCDCMNFAQEPVIDDIGILASKDPVAVDVAALDLISQNAGKSLKSVSYPELNENIQIQHAVEIGLGSDKYELAIIN